MATGVSCEISTAWNIPKFGEYYFSILINNSGEYIISSEYEGITEI